MQTRWGQRATLFVGVAAILLSTAIRVRADEEPPKSYADMRRTIDEWITGADTVSPYSPLPYISLELEERDASRIFFPAGCPLSDSLAEHLGLSKDDPYRDLWGAALLIESFREVAGRVASSHPKLAARLTRAIQRSESFVETGLDEIRRDDQPPPAMLDRVSVLQRRVPSEFNDAVWYWAEETGRRLGYPEPDSEVPEGRPPIPSLEEIRTQAREIASDFPSAFRLRRRGQELEYRIDASEALGVLPDLEDALVTIQARAELVRAFTESREAAGRAGVQAFWTPVIDYIEAYVGKAVAQIGSVEHEYAYVMDRVAVWDARALDAIHMRLWTHAANAELVLWPLATDAGPEARPSTGATEVALRIRGGVREEIIPARYETRTKQVCVTPATSRQEVIPARYELRDGKMVMVEPEQIKRIDVPAVYETVEEQVCACPAVCRDVELPAKWIKLRIHPDFGEPRHIWFLDAWSWKKFTKYRPDPKDLWDLSTPSPPEPWVDLMTDPGALTQRKGRPLVKGWLVVVGAEGASGPARVTFGTEVGAPNVFSVCARPFGVVPAKNE